MQAKDISTNNRCILKSIFYTCGCFKGETSFEKDIKRIDPEKAYTFLSHQGLFSLQYESTYFSFK